MKSLALNTDRNKALIITIGFHLLVILLFLIIRYTVPAIIVTEDYGMEVNLGNSEDGFGDDQPEDPNDPSGLTAMGGGSASAHEEDSRMVHTDDHTGEDNTPVAQPKNPSRDIRRKQPEDTRKKKDNSAAPATGAQQRTSRFGVSDALNSSGNRASNTKPGGNQGDGTGDGDKGKPGGDPNSGNYNGNGGKGSSSFSHTLRDRYVEKTPGNTAEFSKAGTVRVSIRVDRKGNVTVTGVSGSSDPQLNEIAKQKARAHKFNENSNAPIEQKGEIVVNFRVGK